MATPTAISLVRENRSPSQPKIGDVRKYENRNALPRNPSSVSVSDSASLMRGATAGSTYRSM